LHGETELRSERALSARGYWRPNPGQTRSTYGKHAPTASDLRLANKSDPIVLAPEDRRIRRAACRCAGHLGPPAFGHPLHLIFGPDRSAGREAVSGPAERRGHRARGAAGQQLVHTVFGTLGRDPFALGFLKPTASRVEPARRPRPTSSRPARPIAQRSILKLVHWSFSRSSRSSRFSAFFRKLGAGRCFERSWLPASKSAAIGGRPPRDDWLCLLSQFRNGYGLMLTGQIAVRFTLCS
jgi:hypothetical protein